MCAAADNYIHQMVWAACFPYYFPIEHSLFALGRWTAERRLYPENVHVIFTWKGE